MGEVTEVNDRESLKAEVVYLATLQFAHGGLFDGRPADDLIHLVRGTDHGTPGACICGIVRSIGPGHPGWSVGGGITGPDYDPKPCPRCLEVADHSFPGRPVAGIFARLFAAGERPTYHHSADIPRGGK